MTRKRFFISLVSLVLTAACMWGKDGDEVVVTRQLTLNQRNSLPEKTLLVETKQLTVNKKADIELVNAITQVMDTIAQEDYRNRTFVLLLEPKEGGEVTIAAHSDDIVTRGRKDATVMFGSLDYKRYHFVLLVNKDNQELLERTFKRQGKVKFVQEFEFVEFPTPQAPTNVIARWSPARGIRWLTVIINDDPYSDREQQDLSDNSTD